MITPKGRTLTARRGVALMSVLALALSAPGAALAAKPSSPGKSSDHKPAGAGAGHRIR